MRAMDVVNEARGALRASEVFGTPYEKDGITIIPAAKSQAAPVEAGTSRIRRPAVSDSACRRGRSAPS